MIRVLLADDQELLRRGLRGLFELAEGFEVVGEAADGARASSLITQLRPDVSIVDVRMPELGGIEVVERLGADHAIVLLTTFDDADAELRAAAAGARAFLLKDVSFEDLAAIVTRVAKGESLLAPPMSGSARATARAMTGVWGTTPSERLTPRESEVLALMARGFSNREIASALGTREGTVKNHASSILSKLGVRDRTRAVLKAIALGWV